MDGEILIIGAGPAGLACAMELARSGRRADIIERDDRIGGLAKTLTVEQDGDTFLTDIGPHRFFSKNEYLYAFIEDLLHEEWRTVQRITRQYIDGKWYDYPVNAFQVFKNIGPFKAAQNRAAIILYFIFVQTVAVIMYWIGGLWVWEIVGICVLTTPGLMLGMWLGQRLFDQASEEGFRRVALTFLLVIGLATLFL